MRGLISIIGIFGGLGLIAYGTGTALGWFDGSGSLGAIISGAFGLLIGILIIRAMGTDREEAGPYPQAPDPEDIPTSSPLLSDTDSDFGRFETQSPAPVHPGDAMATRRRRGIIVRVVVFLIIGLFAVGGPGRILDGIAGLIGDDAPNVPLHILDACNEALREEVGPTASYGSAYAFEQNTDGTSEVLFRSKQGFEWDCRWDAGAFSAEVTDTRAAP
jgi:hypothetical protein